MQIKPVTREEEEQNWSDDEVDSNVGIPIWSSLESLLIIPPSMSEQLSLAAMRTQEVLDKWSMNRRALKRKFDTIADELDEWEKGCAISTTIGSSVGVASGVAVIGGLIFMPPVAIAGLIVSTAAGASNLLTGVVKMGYCKKKLAITKELFEQDKELFDKLMRSRDELIEMLKKVMEMEENQQNFKNDIDTLNNIKSLLGASVVGASGLATRYAVMSMGRLSSSLVKGVLHSAAVIGIVLDSVSLYLSAKDLSTGAVSSLGEELRTTAAKYELDRQKVCKFFLNQDVWKNSEENKQEGQQEVPQEGEGDVAQDQEHLETMSDTGSFEYMGDFRAATAASDN